MRSRKPGARFEDRLEKLVKARVWKLRFGFETGDCQHSKASALSLFDSHVKQACFSDPGFTAHQERGTVRRCLRKGKVQLSDLGVAPDQGGNHAVKIREPGGGL